MATARNRAIDRLRRDRTLARKTELLARLEEIDVPEEENRLPDERLELIFACCHPSLTADVRIPLTLRMVSGLTTAEIARAYLVPEPTLAQRLVRAKRKSARRPSLCGCLPRISCRNGCGRCSASCT